MRYTIQTRNWLKLRRSEVKTWQQTRLDHFNILLKADRLNIDHKPVHREKIRFGAWADPRGGFAR